MSNSVAQWQRHVVHLMSKVLSLRNAASPFTLVLDDLSQRSGPLIDEFIRRAHSRNINVVILSSEAKKSGPGVHHIPAWTLSAEQIFSQLEKAIKEHKENLVIVDSLYDLLSDPTVDMSTLFHLVAMKYKSTLIGVWHLDLIPACESHNPYSPQPLELVKYMATAIITCKSLAHMIASKAARERSLPEPTYGILHEGEGIIQALDANDTRGIVLDAEFRRQSGREESAVYFLRTASASDYQKPAPGRSIGVLKQEFVTLLDLIPAYSNQDTAAKVPDSEEMESTFNLGLTEKQKIARDGVVLPYFDAQKTMGDAGEGGRILYDMGAEDDFDEEEDEI